MSSDQSLLTFLGRRDLRIASLMSKAKRLRSVDRFKEAANDLELVVEGSKVYFYGTKRMQLGHEKSHLNLFLDVDDSYWMTQSPENVENLIKILMEYFILEIQKNERNPTDKSEQSKFWVGPVRRLKTPVPLVRILFNRGQLQCDITFSSGLGVENSNLVHHMFTLQPEAFKFYHFVRIWIHIDEFSFKRYMVALLVLFYMQHKNLMPSVLQMQEDVKEKFIDGWNVGFNGEKKIEEFGMSKMENYEDHLVEFFKFYENFNFTSNVICPYLGQSVPVNAYPDKEEKLLKYADIIKNYNFQAVNVADVLNLKFNCGFGVGKKRMNKFKHFCGHAVNLLEANL